jgi:hypothetical protein
MASPGALQLVDVLVAGCVEEPPRAAPPAAPVVGQCFIVGSTPTGEWASYVHHVAAYTTGGWRYIPPVSGMCFYVRSEEATACYRAGQWDLGVLRGSSVMIGADQVLGSRAAAIADPTGGAVVDAEARAAITAILTDLRTHGLISS